LAGKPDVFEAAEKKLERAVCVLERRNKGKWRLNIDPDKKTWIERFAKRGLKRGHFWIWKENREVLNDGNFLKVEDFEEPELRLGFNIRSKRVKVRKFRKTLENPIGFHDESLDEWILNKSVNGRLNNGERLKRSHLAGDQDAHRKKWNDRFVKGGLKRGHLWIWKNNREVLDDGNFVKVKNFEKPGGRVGFDIRSRNVELKWHWKSPREPIKVHDESYEEWLLNKAIRHGEKILKEVG
jgi:hypothetical protein